MSSKKTTRQELKKKVAIIKKSIAKEKERELTEEELLFGKDEPEVALEKPIPKETVPIESKKPSKSGPSQLQLLREKLKRDKVIQDRELMKVKPIEKKYIFTGKIPRDRYKEEELRRSFFRTLLTLTVNDSKQILVSLDDFSHKKNASRSREGFIGKITKRLTVPLILEFAKEFTETPEFPKEYTPNPQNGIMSYIFLDDFIKFHTTDEELPSPEDINEHQKLVHFFKELYILRKLDYKNLKERITEFITENNPNNETLKLLEDLYDLGLPTDYEGVTSTILIESYISNFFKVKNVTEEIEESDIIKENDNIKSDIDENDEIFGSDITDEKNTGLIESIDINEITLMENYKKMKHIPEKVEELKKKLYAKRLDEYDDDLFGENIIIPKKIIPKAEREKKLKTKEIIPISHWDNEEVIDTNLYRVDDINSNKYQYDEDKLMGISQRLKNKEKLDDIISSKKIVTVPDDEYFYMKNKKCIDFYLSYAWLPYRVTNMWVQPIQPTNPEDDIFYNSEDTFTYKEDNTDNIGELFYKPTDFFVNAQCGIYRNDRRQDGNILYIKNSEKNEVGFKILFEMNENYRSQDENLFQIGKKYKIQDESVFNKENKLFKKIFGKISSKIEDFGNRTVSFFGIHDTIVLKGLLRENIISTLIFPQNKKEKMIDEIITFFYDDYKDKKLSELFMAFASFLAKFNNNIISFSSILKDRLSSGFYTSTELISKNIEDLIVEVFLDKNRIENESLKIYKHLEISVKNIYDIILHTFYYSINIEEKITPLYIKENIDIEIDRNRLGDICSTIDNPYKLYIIKIKEKYICFDLENIDDDLQKYKFEGIDISDDDILKMRQMSEKVYSLKNAKNEESSIIDITPTKAKNDKELYLDLLIREVLDDILELEEGLGIKGEKYYTITKDPEADFEEQLEAEVKLKEYCEYCDTEINDDSSLKSIMRHKDGSRIVNFCNTICFEQIENWPKFKSKKDALIEVKKIKLGPKKPYTVPGRKTLIGKGKEFFPDTFDCAICKIKVNVPDGDFPQVKYGKHVCKKCYDGLSDNKAYLNILKTEEKYANIENKKCAFCGKDILGKTWRSGTWTVNGKEQILHFDSYDHFINYFNDVRYETTDEYKKAKKKMDKTKKDESCECDSEKNIIKNNCPSDHKPLCMPKKDLDGKHNGYSCICIKSKKQPKKRGKMQALKYPIKAKDFDNPEEIRVNRNLIQKGNIDPFPTGFTLNKKKVIKKAHKEMDVNKILNEGDSDNDEDSDNKEYSDGDNDEENNTVIISDDEEY